MFEVGSVCLKIAGRDANNLCVVVAKLDDNYVVIEGNVRRRKCNTKHLQPQKKKLSVKENASYKEVAAEFKKAGLKLVEKTGFKAEQKPASPAEQKQPQPKKPKQATEQEHPKEAKQQSKKSQKKPLAKRSGPKPVKKAVAKKATAKKSAPKKFAKKK